MRTRRTRVLGWLRSEPKVPFPAGAGTAGQLVVASAWLVLAFEESE
ncbi:hypothetical protein ACIBF6_32660 [Streptosporangium amethystogenes]